MPSTDDLIDQLTAELKPRRPVSTLSGRALVTLVALATVAATVLSYGMRPDFKAGQPDSVPLLTELVPLAVLYAVAVAVTAMARPAVGAARGGWHWAVAALAVLPVAAAVTAIGNASERVFLLPSTGTSCFFIAFFASLATIGVLALWLRRGAPTSSTRAAWLVGIAGGLVGSIAVGFVCPGDAITHIGTWHVGGMLLAAAGSRLLLPAFLRW